MGGWGVGGCACLFLCPSSRRSGRMTDGFWAFMGSLTGAPTVLPAPPLQRPGGATVKGTLTERSRCSVSMSCAVPLPARRSWESVETTVCFLLFEFSPFCFQTSSLSLVLCGAAPAHRVSPWHQRSAAQRQTQAPGSVSTSRYSSSTALFWNKSGLRQYWVSLFRGKKVKMKAKTSMKANKKVELKENSFESRSSSLAANLCSCARGKNVLRAR